MEATVRNKKLADLIVEAGSVMGDLARWPDSEATKKTAENNIKILRKTFKEDSYPRAFLYLAMLQIAHDIFADTVNREVKVVGLKNAWMQLADLLD